MFYTSKELLILTSNFENISLQSLAKKRKQYSRLEQLEQQLTDAKRQGDRETQKELEEEIEKLKKEKL